MSQRSRVILFTIGAIGSGWFFYANISDIWAGGDFLNDILPNLIFAGSILFVIIYCVSQSWPYWWKKLKKNLQKYRD
jgi:hypothetical protein